jgi:hypothetical protein
VLVHLWYQVPQTIRLGEKVRPILEAGTIAHQDQSGALTLDRARQQLDR